jgi:hypothetical protein
MPEDVFLTSQTAIIHTTQSYTHLLHTIRRWSNESSTGMYTALRTGHH